MAPSPAIARLATATNLNDVLRITADPATTSIINAESAIWVLLIRMRISCSSRWVIPGLAEGVTGWLAGQWVGCGSRSSGGCRHRVKMAGVDSRGLARVPV